MKLIIGLGNPGQKYESTRHNFGFLAIKKLHEFYEENFSSFKFEKKFNAEIAAGVIKNEKILLAMPQTFMNNSGQAAQKLVQFYKLNPEKNILIIYDDIDLPLEKIRTKGESAAGHLGMQSIIDVFGAKRISRLRCGILGKPKEKISNTASYVLEKFNKKELEIILKQVLPQVIFKVEEFLNKR